MVKIVNGQLSRVYESKTRVGYFDVYPLHQMVRTPLTISAAELHR